MSFRGARVPLAVLVELLRVGGGETWLGEARVDDSHVPRLTEHTARGQLQASEQGSCKRGARKSVPHLGWASTGLDWSTEEIVYDADGTRPT